LTDKLRITWLSKCLAIAILGLLAAVGVKADPSPVAEAARFMPDRLGNFKAIEPVRPEEVRFVDVTSAGRRRYLSPNGESLAVEVRITRSESAAYALLKPQEPGAHKGEEVRDIGTLAYIFSNEVFFAKGPIYVTVDARNGKSDARAAVDLARQISGLMDKVDGDIPPLVKHLPDWQKVEPDVSYALDPVTLKGIAKDQQIIAAISFDGGTEAVAARYDQSQLVIVEFTTPQLAGDNDRRIVEKIQELSKEGKPVPSAYRRVGNYSVFVFNAPNEQTANQLIDQVKYEQVVQWLGDNPNWLKEAQRQYTETMLGTFVSVMKASGLAAVLCFGIGGFFGAMLFAKRRAEQAAQRAYSDAGGMMRLNIDELSGETDPRRLVGPGKT